VAPPLSAGFIMIFESFLKSTKLGWGEVWFAWMENEAFIGFGNNFASS